VVETKSNPTMPVPVASHQSLSSPVATTMAISAERSLLLQNNDVYSNNISSTNEISPQFCSTFSTPQTYSTPILLPTSGNVNSPIVFPSSSNAGGHIVVPNTHNLNPGSVSSVGLINAPNQNTPILNATFNPMLTQYFGRFPSTGKPLIQMIELSCENLTETNNLPCYLHIEYRPRAYQPGTYAHLWSNDPSR